MNKGDIVLFGKEEDWKELLCANASVELAELIERSKQHRCAYMQADDVKVAQVWCALTEVSRQVKGLESRLERMESAVKAVAKIGEIGKREALKTKVSDIMKPKTSEEREQIDKIVETLMQF